MKFLFVLLLLVILEVNAFVSNDMMKLYKLSRSNPLRTAGSENRGYIPRLDPGLRLIQPQVENTPQFLSFSLDWLKDSTDNIQVTRIPLDTLFSKLADKVSAMALKAAQFFKSIFKAFVAVLPVMLTMAIGLNRKTTTSQISQMNTIFPSRSEIKLNKFHEIVKTSFDGNSQNEIELLKKYFRTQKSLANPWPSIN